MEVALVVDPVHRVLVRPLDDTRLSLDEVDRHLAVVVVGTVPDWTKQREEAIRRRPAGPHRELFDRECRVRQVSAFVLDVVARQRTYSRELAPHEEAALRSRTGRAGHRA